MRIPFSQPNVRNLMVATATLAVAFSVFRGTGPVTLAIIGLGYALAMLGLEDGMTHGGVGSAQSPPVKTLSTICRDGMTILFDGFILGGLFYFLFVFLRFVLYT